MEMLFQVKMNEKLFLRDPEQSELGKKSFRRAFSSFTKMGLKPLPSKNWRKLSAQPRRVFTGILKISTDC
jgi:hypothetical protein